MVMNQVQKLTRGDENVFVSLLLIEVSNNVLLNYLFSILYMQECIMDDINCREGVPNTSTTNIPSFFGSVCTWDMHDNWVHF